jgi:hypothetical protein
MTPFVLETELRKFQATMPKTHTCQRHPAPCPHRGAEEPSTNSLWRARLLVPNDCLCQDIPDEVASENERHHRALDPS